MNAKITCTVRASEYASLHQESDCAGDSARSTSAGHLVRERGPISATGRQRRSTMSVSPTSRPSWVRQHPASVAELVRVACMVSRGQWAEIGAEPRPRLVRLSRGRVRRWSGRPLSRL